MLIQKKSDETVSALLDFNNDNTVNAKDFAILNRQ
ncbi:MAG: dockerin type I domain-containing protein [Eubacterium sp.]